MIKKDRIQIAIEFIKKSKAILVGAGAGIGRDSGLPDFRGKQGFWKNYPPYRGLFDFFECANPNFLKTNPKLFWGFYGSRLEMYRKTNPHKGFQIILDFHRKHKKELFVLTSNVDGQFQKAGFCQESLFEIHGSIHYLQCDKCLEIKANNFQPKINSKQMSSQTLPFCKNCGQIERPNILMFDDNDWISERSDEQAKNYYNFLKKITQQNKQICLIEIGAGDRVPTIRNMLQRNYFQNTKTKYIRINPDPQDNSKVNPQRFIHIQLDCLNALSQIQEYLKE